MKVEQQQEPPHKHSWVNVGEGANGVKSEMCPKCGARRTVR